MAPALAPQRTEVRRPVVASDHASPSIRNDVRLDAVRGFDDCREAIGPVMAVAGEAADARAIPAHHQPITVMLDFVNPQRAGRSRRLRRRAWFDEAEGRRKTTEDRRFRLRRWL